ncbi:MAG: matrixin family metalloprotease, partial [Chthoniobacterales bacterium]|nr:matrixin family metalloprotease [Chthoniobacterales bacterium]
MNIKISSGRAAVFLLSFCAAVALLADKSSGYSLENGKWTLNRTVVMNLSLGAPRLLSDGFRSFDESAADALKIWNQHLIHMKFRPVLGSPLRPTGEDADTSVFFASTVYGETFGARVLAVTLFTTRPPIVAEADVTFNNAREWDSYRGPLRSTVDFHRVALHEFGHVFGLNHPDDNGQQVTAVMNATVSGVDSLQTDDINGAGALYNAGPEYRSSVPAPTLANLSTRAAVGKDANVLIGGFIVQGSQPATIVIRGIGHSLAAQNIARPLTDPMIDLRDSAGALIASSDDWISQANAPTIASYHLDPANSRESALLQTLKPGSYTVVLRAFDNQDGDLTGTGIIELYDLHTTGGRAGNISSRGQVLRNDDVMVAGFIIGGGASKELVIRGIGPSLTKAGLPNALPNPGLELHDASGNLIRQNDDWQDDAQSAEVLSSGLAPTDSREAALYAKLNP